MKKILTTIMIITLLILLFDKVDALTLTQDVEVYDSRVIDYTNTDLTQEILYKRKLINSNTNQIQYYAWNVTNYGFTPEIDYLEIPIMFSWTNNATSNTTNTIDICDRWNWLTIDSNNQVIRWGCDHVDSYDIVDKEYVPNNPPSGYQFGFYAHNIDGGYSMCQIQENYLVCPTRQRDIDFIGMLYDFRNSGNATINMYISLGTVWNRYRANSTVNAINQQTQQQQQQFNQDHTYNNTPSQDINGTNELNDYSNQEDQLINSLDFNMTVMDGITINPLASAFIWNVTDRLRGINPKIILLMTSILGLGIIKMILNR